GGEAAVVLQALLRPVQAERFTQHGLWRVDRQQRRDGLLVDRGEDQLGARFGGYILAIALLALAGNVELLAIRGLEPVNERLEGSRVAQLETQHRCQAQAIERGVAF